MFYILIFIIGLSIGSFLNVLIDRLPKDKSITGRSHCDHCRKKLAWYDLIPILSYLYLGAKCKYCGKRISFFYPLIEAVTGMMFVVVVMLLSLNIRGSLFALGGFFNLENFDLVKRVLISIHTLALLGIVSMAIVIFFSDLEYQIIPDSIQLALFVFSFFFLLTGGITAKVFFNQVGAAFVVMIPILFLFLGTKGKSMGFGDVKLAFNLGFLLGLLGGALALYIGFVSGAIIGVILILFKKKGLKSKIAFGPFLVLGLVIMLFFGNSIVQIVRTKYPF
ncbi:hypothetical protein A3I50_01825 [Candidatus Roizmanbacteria bacterium RIFCSPLOWO2_02_FULL_37_9]|nr:MAG: hypothetical protein A2859_04150 [Candidatus Roizmanbacteria bacterium RIFCSPHIGHO2_01_FULL_37_16b]OGK32999.1 MAG: hypothetical protein A3F57_01765 [Candidatus Roizmanbacteria bacterium RIFCSPHIGHO2_12_FULL_36_11]OGK56189.1 MAG: hypothetical protein A3I50_01825 [Candidatus Roizmanbacteria bacterium RIFCSPLOWO2_02_FULL_37_9]